MKPVLFLLVGTQLLAASVPCLAKEKTGLPYPQKIEEELTTLGRKVEHLKARAESAGVKNRSELDRQIGNLEDELRVARRKLEEWQNATAGQREGLRKGLDATLRKLKTACGKVARRFRADDAQETKEAKE